MNVLIVGVTGMLGYGLFQRLSNEEHLDVYGTARSLRGKTQFFDSCSSKVFEGIDVSNLEGLKAVIEKVCPSVVINCIGLIKQHDISQQHVNAIAINSLLPHQLASLCDRYFCKLIHFSTDCVFDGEKGLYKEEDLPNTQDLYGRSKLLGEIDYPPHLTLRTSIIGHELSSSVSLVDWFLSQKDSVNGFSEAVFSGLPTCTIAQLLSDKILPKDNLSGLYHLSVEPINKFALLKLIAKVYDKKIEIVESKSLKIDRSLNSEKLCKDLNFKKPSWHTLVLDMHNDFKRVFEKYR